MKQVKVLFAIVFIILLGTWMFASAWTMTAESQKVSNGKISTGNYIQDTTVEAISPIIESATDDSIDDNSNIVFSDTGLISPKTGQNDIIIILAIITIGLDIIVIILIIFNYNFKKHRNLN